MCLSWRSTSICSIAAIYRSKAILTSEFRIVRASTMASHYPGFHYVELKGIPEIYVQKGEPLWAKKKGAVCYKVAGATPAHHWYEWKGGEELISSAAFPYCINGFARVNTRGIAALWTTTGTHILKCEHNLIQYKIIGTGRKFWTTLDTGPTNMEEYGQLRRRAAKVKARTDSKLKAVRCKL